MRRSTFLMTVLMLALLAAMAAKSLLIEIPPVRVHNAPGQFDANRAAARLAFVLGDQQPHPADTPADDRVRDRLVALLRKIGVTPVIRDQIACNQLYKQRGVTCARVRNVIALLGPPTGKALLLNAHYDSTPVGPGAGDDGVGVATLLEIAALLKDKPLNRPLILLFNEGEELGLVGARAFLADPLSRNVDSLINLEARGVRGPANMFETSRPNAAAIAVFSRAVAHPVANSLSTDVYRLLPNYTDVNSFSERGWLTLNIAVIGNETRYHSAGDNLAALDRASLQHMGDQTLALTEQLANGAPQTKGERIFMDVIGSGLITLPLSVGMAVLVVLLIAFGWAGWKRGQLATSGALTFGAMLLSAALAWAGIALIGTIRGGMFWRAYPIWTHLAGYASALFVAVSLLAIFDRQITRAQLRAGFWFTYLLIGVLVGLIAPGGIIYFLFPPAAALIGILISRYWPFAEHIGSAMAILLLYATLGAMLGLLEELLNQGPMWTFAAVGVLILLPVLIETKPLLHSLSARIVVVLGGTLVLACWIAAAVAPAYSEDRQQSFILEHVTDANTRRAQWSVVNDSAPLPGRYRHIAQWREGKLPYSERERWLAKAPAAPGIEAPAITLLGSLSTPAGRTIRIRLQPNGAENTILIALKNADIVAAGTDGFIRRIDPAAEEGRYAIECFGRGCDGMPLQLFFANRNPVEFVLIGSRPGLPPSAQPLLTARSKYARPQYAPDEMVAFTRVRL